MEIAATMARVMLGMREKCIVFPPGAMFDEMNIQATDSA
jgi:hypothetical protein